MQIFGTRFWGFNPKEEPFVGFTYPGSQAALIRDSQPGDLIVILGTKNEPTPKIQQGALLGLIEFERVPANAEDLLPLGADVSPHLLDERGRFRWPYAVPALKAWQFDKPYPVRDVIGRQFSMAATTSVDKLSPSEVERVLALSRIEIDIGKSRAQTRRARLTSGNRLIATASGQPGPLPSEWSAITSREDGPTATYLFRFGTRDCWKIGISQNPSARLSALNFSVPREVLGEEWVPELQHVWPNGQAAYDMEQALLTHLKSRVSTNERVCCDDRTVKAAWTEYLQGRL